MDRRGKNGVKKSSNGIIEPAKDADVMRKKSGIHHESIIFVRSLSSMRIKSI